MNDPSPTYRILWAPCPRESDVGRRIGADRDLWLPYLVEADGLAKLDAGQGVPFDDYDLAQGILAAYFEVPGEPSAPRDLAPYLSCALDELVTAFQRPSLEVMVLELARGMGQRHGWALAREALRTGRALLPESPQIACDYVVALWRMLESREATEPVAVLHEILDLCPAADSTDLRPMAREYLALVHLGAMAAGEEYTGLPALLEEARRLVADPYLRGKLQELERQVELSTRTSGTSSSRRRGPRAEMPELPEVESARRRAEAALSGHLIVEVAAVPDRIVFAGVSAARFASSLRGRRVLKVHRKGKQLWMQLDERPFPLFHFGMTGSFQLYRNVADRPRFWKVELVMDDGVRLAMPDARRFGRIRLQDEPEHEAPLKDLGADPLLSPQSAAQTADLLRRRHAPVKAALLDQRLFAGVGNWIADEVLYQARIRPQRPASSLSPAEVRRLRSCLLSILRRAVAVDADSDRFPRTWLFHHRWGKNAEARTSRGEKITHHTIGGRTTAWVPKRQR